MAKHIQERKPLSEAEILEYLNQKVEEKVKQWGEDSFWAKDAIKSRDSLISKWKQGEVIKVYSEDYRDSYGNGLGEFREVLLSNGKVETECYGYVD